MVYAKAGLEESVAGRLFGLPVIVVVVLNELETVLWHT